MKDALPVLWEKLNVYTVQLTTSIKEEIKISGYPIKCSKWLMKEDDGKAALRIIISKIRSKNSISQKARNVLNLRLFKYVNKNYLITSIK